MLRKDDDYLANNDLDDGFKFDPITGGQKRKRRLRFRDGHPRCVIL